MIVGTPSIPFLLKGPCCAAGVPSGSEIERFRGQIANREALTFFDYWISKCSGNDMPRKERIDPVEIPELLSAMFIEEWDAELQQSRIRLAGEFHREPDGSSIQNLAVDDLSSGLTNEIWKRCDHYNFFELRPTICGYSLEHFDRPHRQHADLAVPVRDGSNSVLVYGYSWRL
jgi:hypothetical protein